MTEGSNHENDACQQPDRNPSPPCHEPLLTIAEACRLFNLKPHVLRRAIKAHSIPSYRLGNGRIRLGASDITAVIDASRSGGAK